MTTESVTMRTAADSVPERLTGEVVFGANGEPATPSTASVFSFVDPIPTMLVDRELNYLQWLASRTTGRGRIVELGCFLGGSTAALVAGLDLADRDLTGKNAHEPILTYDAFATIDDDTPSYLSLLNLYGLRKGEGFRERFDVLNAAHLHRLSVREGWLPCDASREEEIAVYPEQAPIELLFVDVAKTWDVHLTVLRSFGRHLIEGGMVVQQDFFDLQTPWIPLHMWQMREVLVPTDVLRGTPTLGLECRGDVGAALDGLWKASDLVDRSARTEAWEQVIAYWANLVGASDAELFTGHAAMHAVSVGDIDDGARWGRRFEAWSRSSDSNGVYFPPAWPETIATLPMVLERNGTPFRSADVLSAECVARGSRLDRRRPGERGTYRPFRQRVETWERVAADLLADGHTRVALFGAGRHTAWLLDEGLLAEAGIDVACIIDDEPRAETLGGVPVVASAGFVSGDWKTEWAGVSAVLPSSDTFEPRLMTRLLALFGSEGPEIVRVYTDAAHAGETMQPNWEYALEIVPGTPRAERTNPERVADSSVDRLGLGLPESRDWGEVFRDRFRVPSWCDNFAHAHELAFMWDLIEATRPRTIVEIGTASGVSTAMLAAAADRFCDEETRVCSFDIATECYFDRSRSLAAAVAEMAPDLESRARLFARANALDAASCFPVGGVEFAFIDGEHGHPAPTLDLLSLVYAMRPGAWVALHDIELGNFTMEVEGVSWEDNSGAGRLFEAWPFEKIQPSGESRAMRNIGAIRMPADPADAVAVLLECLAGEIEIGGPDRERAEAARAILGL